MEAVSVDAKGKNEVCTRDPSPSARKDHIVDPGVAGVDQEGESTCLRSLSSGSEKWDPWVSARPDVLLVGPTLDPDSTGDDSSEQSFRGRRTAGLRRCVRRIRRLDSGRPFPPLGVGTWGVSIPPQTTITSHWLRPSDDETDHLPTHPRTDTRVRVDSDRVSSTWSQSPRDVVLARRHVSSDSRPGLR